MGKYARASLEGALEIGANRSTGVHVFRFKIQGHTLDIRLGIQCAVLQFFFINDPFLFFLFY